MANPLLSLRRIATSIVLAALLGAGGFVAIGTAAADVPVFTLPARHAGDRVDYASNLDVEDRKAVGTLEQLQLFAWKDAQGRHRLVDGLRQEVARDDATLAAHSFLAADADNAPLAATSGLSLGRSTAAGLGGNESTQEQVSRLAFGWTRHPCGFVNSLQGAEAAAQLTTHCDGPRIFSLVGSAPWNGGEAAVFSSGNTSLWFQTDIPYPVRIESGAIWYEMTGFTRGSEPLLAAPLPPDTPLPMVSSAPRPDHGADFTGIPMRYSLEHTIEAAMSDPTFPDLREFLAAHREARVVAAEHVGESDQEVWMIRWADERDGFGLFAHHRRAGAASLLGLDLDAGWRTDFTAHPGHGVLDEPPVATPPLAQVAAAWQVYTGSDEQPRVIGFQWLGCMSCPWEAYAGSVGTFSWAGNDAWDTGRPPSQTVESGHTLHYDADGDVTAISMTERAASRGGSLPGPLAPAPLDALATPSGWSAPQAAAGIGLGALLVGAAYWAWPLVKSLPVLGLRWGRRSPLLDHPVRRRLHATISQKPGIHYHEIVRGTGLGKGAVEHHLRRLVANGAIKCVRNDGYSCYFPAATDHRAAAAAGALKSAGAQQVLQAVQAHPGAAVTDIARLTGLSPGTVSHHLRRLRQRGVIESWREGRTVRLRAGSVVAFLP